MKEKNKFVIDLQPETHRNASDCTCAYCMKKESEEFIDNQNKKIENGFLEFQEREIISETGRMS